MQPNELGTVKIKCQYWVLWCKIVGFECRQSVLFYHDWPRERTNADQASPPRDGQAELGIVCLRMRAGNPFCFTVIDPAKVSVRGDGLGLVKANQATSFVVSAPAADLPDLDVVITGNISATCLLERSDLINAFIIIIIMTNL